jgi:hypothetical protein
MHRSTRGGQLSDPEFIEPKTVFTDFVQSQQRREREDNEQENGMTLELHVRIFYFSP